MVDHWGRMREECGKNAGRIFSGGGVPSLSCGALVCFVPGPVNGHRPFASARLPPTDEKREGVRAWAVGAGVGGGVGGGVGVNASVEYDCFWI